MKAKLIKTSIGIYRLMVENSDYDYGHTSPEYCELQNRDGSYSHKLSLKNCQAIERGYDLDEMASHNSLSYTWLESNEKDKAIMSKYGIEGFKAGFQKALELLGNKKFSEEDLRLAMHFGQFGEANNQTTTIGFIQSLQQTEWHVEIEMEKVKDETKIVGAVKGVKGSGNKITTYKYIPKLDADGCLILKRKV